MVIRQDQRQVVSQRIDPKLIMANTVLQQNSQELVQHIETELLENPALDVLEEVPVCQGDCVDPLACPYCSQRIARSKNEQDTASDYEPDVEFHTDVAHEPEDDYDPIGNLEAEVTFQDHLRALLRAALPESDYDIGDYLISSLDDNGWLEPTTAEIASELQLDEGEVCRVLRVIQGFDPPGVGARDLQECLLIQLQSLREDDRPNAIAERMVRNHFRDIINPRYTRLARALGISVEKARQTVDFIREQLNPYPASQFRPPWVYKPNNCRAAVRPDVVIRRTEFGFEVDVAGTETYALGINPSYRAEYNRIKQGNGKISEENRKHITDYVERAELFIKNINQRRKTLRLITSCIIECQQGFLETGLRAYVRPLTRTRVAQILDLHESTVSRATANKFVQLPNQEVVPFDLFFNPSLSIKSAIEEIISREDPGNPLSDQQIAEELKERGMLVARRTVVKYRESQKLLSSARRRR